MKLTEIQDLIKFVSKSGVNEVELETKEIKIVIKTGKQSAAATCVYQAAPAQITTAPAQVIAAPAAAAAAPAAETATPAATNTAAANESKYVTIKSPMIGTFYRSSGRIKRHLLTLEMILLLVNLYVSSRAMNYLTKSKAK